jgi:hypothetical protein
MVKDPNPMRISYCVWSAQPFLARLRAQKFKDRKEFLGSRYTVECPISNE